MALDPAPEKGALTVRMKGIDAFGQDGRMSPSRRPPVTKRDHYRLRTERHAGATQNRTATMHTTYFEDVTPLAIDEELMTMLDDEASCPIEGLAALSVGIEGPDGEVYRVIETQGLWETVRVFDALRARGLSITAGRAVGDRNLSRVFRQI